MAKVRYIRVGDHLDDDTVIVVRGGPLDAELIRTDAARMFAIYEIYGISVFAAQDLSVDELAQEPPLVRFADLTLVTVGDLRATNFRLEPTGRNRRHYTVVFDDLDDGVVRLIAIRHQLLRNPYYEE